MRIVTVLGTRPQLIKAAALSPVLRTFHDEVLIDTGQHWDEQMAGAFFSELGLPRPDYSLGVGGGGHADQTGRMLLALGPILERERPDVVLVYGDTNSTLAGALVAAKFGIPLAHVEAGLRSFDRRMPEEINRIVSDHLAQLLFAPTPAAVANLVTEGIIDGVELVGDLMQDLAAATIDSVRDVAMVKRVVPGLRSGHYYFATVHRAENRTPEAIREWVALLDAIATAACPVVLALHPGTRAAMHGVGSSLGPNVHVVEPQGYRMTLALQLHAAAVLTDSGGVQREASWLGVPCLVLRGTTEWVEAVADSAGRMRLVGTSEAAAVEALREVAPVHLVGDDARARAREGVVQPSGAAIAIVAALSSLAPVNGSAAQ